LLLSLEDENISVRDESFEFNKRFVSNGQARLLKEGKNFEALKEYSSYTHIAFVISNVIFTFESSGSDSKSSNRNT
jgi:oleate hydratase